MNVDQGRILHVALFTWRDDVTAEQVTGLTSDLEEMAAAIDPIVHYACGPDLGLVPSTADFVVAAAVRDAPGLREYLGHPLHRAVQQRWLDAMVHRRIAAQVPLPFPVADAG